MKEILSKLFGFLKFILLIIAFGLVFYGIMATYARLQKPLTEAVNVFLPFVLVLIVFFVNMIIGGKYSRSRLLFNFVSCFSLMVTIIIGLRSLLDKNMLLYYKYDIKFNPTFFADNLSGIQVMLYMIFAANILLIVYEKLSGKKKLEEWE